MCKLKLCVDVRLPGAAPSGALSAWGLKRGWLKQNEIIKYSMRGQDEKHVQEWNVVFREVEDFTNLTFVESKWEDALMRISHTPGLSYSYVGSDNYHTDKTVHNVNIGWHGTATKRHEGGGHFVGLGHEHQNPKNGIDWNEPYVINTMAEDPNFWPEGKTRMNILRTYNKDQTIGTGFDMDSIMLYFFPKEFTHSGFATKQNEYFSKLDKEFLFEIYPKKSILVNVPETIESKFIKGHFTSKGQLENNHYKVIKSISGALDIPYSGKKNTVEKIWKSVNQ